MKNSKRAIERSDDQVQISVSLPRELLEELEKAADKYTRSNRSRLLVAALSGLLRTDRMEEMVKEGQVQQLPLNRSEQLKIAFALIKKQDPETAKALKKLPLFDAKQRKRTEA